MQSIVNRSIEKKNKNRNDCDSYLFYFHDCIYKKYLYILFYNNNKFDKKKRDSHNKFYKFLNIYLSYLICSYVNYVRGL